MFDYHFRRRRGRDSGSDSDEEFEWRRRRREEEREEEEENEEKPRRPSMSPTFHLCMLCATLTILCDKFLAFDNHQVEGESNWLVTLVSGWACWFIDICTSHSNRNVRGILGR